MQGYLLATEQRLHPPLYPPLAKGGIVLAVIFLLSMSFAQSWSQATDSYFTVFTASTADALYLKEVFEILQSARQDIRKNPQLQLPEQVNLYIHPSLESFSAATGKAWYIALVADRTKASIHSQRLRVLLERQSLEQSLRHELFHLAQPDDWPRWLAEGSAMLFAAEPVTARPFDAISESELNELLLSAKSQDSLARAAATAYAWAKLYWQERDYDRR